MPFANKMKEAGSLKVIEKERPFSKDILYKTNYVHKGYNILLRQQYYFGFQYC